MSVSKKTQALDLKASILNCEFYHGNKTYVESLVYDLEFLKIIVIADSTTKLEITFHQPIGFRCLDEGDLLEFWDNSEITNNWIVEIHNSGWLEQESNRKGFLSRTSELREFLVMGQNDCISVLDTNSPNIKLIENDL